MKTWNLTCTDVTKYRDKIRVVRQIRLLTSLGLREAKDLADGLGETSQKLEITYDELLAPELEVESREIFTDNGIQINEDTFRTYAPPGWEAIRL